MVSLQNVLLTSIFLSLSLYENVPVILKQNIISLNSMRTDSVIYLVRQMNLTSAKYFNWRERKKENYMSSHQMLFNYSWSMRKIYMLLINALNNMFTPLLDFNDRGLLVCVFVCGCVCVCVYSSLDYSLQIKEKELLEIIVEKKKSCSFIRVLIIDVLFYN